MVTAVSVAEWKATHEPPSFQETKKSETAPLLLRVVNIITFLKDRWIMQCIYCTYIDFLAAEVISYEQIEFPLTL